MDQLPQLTADQVPAHTCHDEASIAERCARCSWQAERFHRLYPATVAALAEATDRNADIAVFDANLAALTEAEVRPYLWWHCAVAATQHFYPEELAVGDDELELDPDAPGRESLALVLTELLRFAREGNIKDIGDVLRFVDALEDTHTRAASVMLCRWADAALRQIASPQRLAYWMLLTMPNAMEHPAAAFHGARLAALAMDGMDSSGDMGAFTDALNDPRVSHAEIFVLWADFVASHHRPGSPVTMPLPELGTDGQHTGRYIDTGTDPATLVTPQSRGMFVAVTLVSMIANGERSKIRAVADLVGDDADGLVFAGALHSMCLWFVLMLKRAIKLIADRRAARQSSSADGSGASGGEPNSQQ